MWRRLRDIIEEKIKRIEN
jgi:hypothetical protein